MKPVFMLAFTFLCRKLLVDVTIPGTSLLLLKLLIMPWYYTIMIGGLLHFIVIKILCSVALCW